MCGGDGQMRRGTGNTFFRLRAEHDEIDVA